MVNATLLADFKIDMKWSTDSKLWMNGEADEIDFDKIQLIANYILSLGTNFKKNLTQLHPEMIAAMPEFLINVPNA